MPKACHSPRYARPACLLAALLVAAGSARAQDLSQQLAEARAPGGGALLYREQHLLRSDGGRPRERLVLYRCPGGAAFARKRLDYVASAQAPAFALEDRRAGYAEGLRRLGARIELYSRARNDAVERRAALAVAPAVADAGFDEFVRANWTRLLAGEALPLRFAVPSRGRAMQFEVQRLRAASVGGEAAELFRLRLGGLLGLVAPHIDVAYAARSRRLLRFEGVSNLRDAGGRRQLEARIDFPAPPQPVPEANWRAALSEPLVAACGSGQGADS